MIPSRRWMRELAACPLGEAADAIVVDMHAEATSEKMAMGHFCDGRASLVVGTHQHVPTADAQILPGGTAYQSDAGACCDYDSVIGMDKAEPLQRFVRKISSHAFYARHRPRHGLRRVCGNRRRGLGVTGSRRSGWAAGWTRRCRDTCG